ncbi:hypothetical protein CONPUDRAFT_164421 [Coniophora puteana RWD-64-598 SS2]|uniref:Uncharacterized protein n=1 Tax=Coniophora puteana (strain RWD-64-598) TaxID=741705 RepID=A0A5M3MWP5_CONPW|nr:uncharacterized protein CONPUDRAFT_164421 [Coniophora puteana RWD-64-598 SS2]EIW83490.1 hypothetical protein CONPUDRAFT_164421 [Coniophora puteana RWD-64-598 SS2]
MHDFHIRDDKRRTKGRLAQIEWARDALRIMYDYTNTRRDKASDKGITFADDNFDEEYDVLDQTQKSFEETLKAETTMQSLTSLIWNKDVDVEQHVEKVEEFWDRTQVSWATLDRRLRQPALPAALQSAASLPANVGAVEADPGSGTPPLPVISPQPAEQRSQSAPLPSQPTPPDAASVSPTEDPADRLQSPAPKSGPSTNGTYSFYNSHNRGNTFQIGGSNNNGSVTQVQHHGGMTTTNENVISGSESHLSSIERLTQASKRDEIAKAEAEADAARRNAHQGRRGPAPHRSGYYPHVVSTGNNINLHGNSSMEDPSIQSGNGNTGGTKIVHNYNAPRTIRAAA